MSRSLSTLLALLPRGRAWPRTVGTRLHDLMTAIAAEFDRIDQAGRALLLETVPGTLTDLLPEWEALTQADECGGVGASIEARRAAVVARIMGGSPTEQAVEAVIEGAGYAPTFEYWAPFRVGGSTVGDPLTNDEWQHAIGVDVVQRSPTDDAALECVVEHMQHAHVVVVWFWQGAAASLLLEDGSHLLLEDGSRLLLE